MSSPSASDGRAVFKNRDFTRLIGARLCSATAVQMQAVAIGWQVYEVTRDPLDLGLVGLAEFLPFVGFALITGQVADRLDRRRILLVCYLTFLLCSGLLLHLSTHVLTNVWPIFGVLLLLGTARAFSMPAQQSLTPNLVPREQLGSAIAWGSTAFQAATIGGPAVGGLLFAFGAHTVYAVSAGLLAIAALQTARIQTRSARRSPEPVNLSTIFAGIRFIAVRRPILGAITLDLFAVLLGGATALLPIYARDILFAGPTGLGFLRSAPAIGATLIAIYLAYRPLGEAAGRIMLISVGVFGVGTVVFGLSTNFALSMAALIVTGGADMLSVFVRSTLIQAGTPDDMRGRVSAVNALFIGASNELGQFESGVAAKLLGVVASVVSGGVGAILIAGGWSVLFPSLRQVDLTRAGIDRLVVEGARVKAENA